MIAKSVRNVTYFNFFFPHDMMEVFFQRGKFLGKDILVTEATVRSHSSVADTRVKLFKTPNTKSD